ncbi:MAG: hypothetical protein ISR58_14310 [Anaerolineales bacterium]|nr:hypothetical protein [Chloroflexota bacterium]MBL6982349.1 hypothetical protein [Anaerolineales bacterium]
MTQVIIIQGGSLESYYEQTLDYLHAKYHSYPSNLPELSVDPDVECELGYYERLARKIAEEAGIDGSIPLGKLVI